MPENQAFRVNNQILEKYTSCAKCLKIKGFNV